MRMLKGLVRPRNLWEFEWRCLWLKKKSQKQKLDFPRSLGLCTHFFKKKKHHVIHSSSPCCRFKYSIWSNVYLSIHDEGVDQLFYVTGFFWVQQLVVIRRQQQLQADIQVAWPPILAPNFPDWGFDRLGKLCVCADTFCSAFALLRQKMQIVKLKHGFPPNNHASLIGY